MNPSLPGRRWMGIDQEAAPAPAALTIASPEYLELLEAVNSGERGMRLVCPHCGQSARIRTSKVISPLMREAFFQCTNIVCGHTFVAAVEIVRTLSPSMVPDPAVALQLRQSKHAADKRKRDASGSKEESPGSP